MFQKLFPNLSPSQIGQKYAMLALPKTKGTAVMCDLAEMEVEDLLLYGMLPLVSFYFKMPGCMFFIEICMPLSHTAISEPCGSRMFLSKGQK